MRARKTTAALLVLSLGVVAAACGDDEETTEATTANLSRGGVFVHSWEPLAAGRRVIVALDLPTGGELSLVGRVAWTRRKLTPPAGELVESPGYGIEFVGGSRADQAAIQRILDEAAPASPASAQTALQAPSQASSQTALQNPLQVEPPAQPTAPPMSLRSVLSLAP